ncbi:response regulator [Roseobacteraceae bacterium S113]
MKTRDRLHVMVVDDMSTSRGLITQALDWMGISNYDYARSGDEAYRKLAAKPVHLVISDYNMPGLNGLQLLESLRMNRQTQRVGFILVTGSADTSIIDAGRRLQMNNYVKKPFAPQVLKKCIEQIVGPL